MALDSAIEVISRYRTISDAKSYVFDGDREEIDRYLKAVDEIQRFIYASPASDDQSRAKSAIQIAMAQLANEISNILNLNAKSTLNPNSATYSSSMTDSASASYEVHEDDYVYGNTLSAEVIHDLLGIADRMNSAGYLEGCKKAYIRERKHSINTSYQRLNIQKLTSTDAQRMEWKELESIIKAWINSAKICFGVIFAYEKQLWEKIFKVDTDDLCYVEIIKDHATQLLDIAETLGCIRKASERLFGVVELHKALHGLKPQINDIFRTKSFGMRASNQILPMLAGAVNEMLLAFEKAVLTADISRSVPVDQIHSLSRYGMDYVSKLCQHKQALMALSLSKPPSTTSAGMSLKMVEFEGQSELSFHVIWIITCLLSKLEGIARLYEDVSARHFFLLNNIHYIVQKIDGKPEVREMVGHDSFKNLSRKLDQAKAEFIRLTFGKVLHCLREEGLTERGILSFRYLKLSERLKTFNGGFTKLQRDLAKLVVPDFQLLRDLRESIEEKLVPAYTTFLGHVSSEPRLMNEVKLTADELKAVILVFFISTPNTSNR